MRRYLVGTVLAFVALPAMAADFSFYEPPPAYGYSSSGWSGQYLGLTGGGQRTHIDVPGEGALEGYGLIGGIFAGVNFQQDNGLVLGAEADADYSSFHQSTACSNPVWTCRGGVDFQGSLRGRVGFAVDAFHVYGTAGLAAARVNGSTTSPLGAQFDDSEIFVGWTAGLGAEVAFSDAWFARAEYRYTDYGHKDMTFDVAYPGVRVTSHALRAGVGYRF